MTAVDFTLTNQALKLVYSVMQDTEPRREAPIRLLDIDQRSFPGDIRDLPDTEDEEEREESDEYGF